MPEHLIPIRLGGPAQNLASATATVSRLPFQETIAHLKGAIESEELWLIHEIDPQLLLGRAGYSSLGLRQLLFFHPRYLVQLLEADPRALVEVPLKLVVLELPDGKVAVSRPEILVSIGSYSKMGALAGELDGICKRLVSTISVSPSTDSCNGLGTNI
jgi:uncharacterized protein (DUF302 family)